MCIEKKIKMHLSGLFHTQKIKYSQMILQVKIHAIRLFSFHFHTQIIQSHIHTLLTFLVHSLEIFLLSNFFSFGKSLFRMKKIKPNEKLFGNFTVLYFHFIFVVEKKLFFLFVHFSWSAEANGRLFLFLIHFYFLSISFSIWKPNANE